MNNNLRALKQPKRGGNLVVLILGLVFVGWFVFQHRSSSGGTTSSATGGGGSERGGSSMDKSQLGKSIIEQDGQELAGKRDSTISGIRKAASIAFGRKNIHVDHQQQEKSSVSSDFHVTLFFGASVGSIKIKLLPQYSKASYRAWVLASSSSLGSNKTDDNENLHEEADHHHQHHSSSACRGPLYRSEKNFLIQGRIDCPNDNPGRKALQAIPLGECPKGAKPNARRRCPEHDPHCGCHGPVMQPGMVGWAGGKTGPDFFILTSPQAAEGWFYDHTVWGEVPKSDLNSWATIEKISDMPIKQSGIMKLLQKELKWEFSSV